MVDLFNEGFDGFHGLALDFIDNVILQLLGCLTPLIVEFALETVDDSLGYRLRHLGLVSRVSVRYISKVDKNRDNMHEYRFWIAIR